MMRDLAIDAALRSLFPDDSQTRDSWRPEIARALDAANFSPVGDNHHNAAACPHCSLGRSDEGGEEGLRERFLSGEVGQACEEALDLLGDVREDRPLDGVVETVLTAALDEVLPATTQKPRCGGSRQIVTVRKQGGDVMPCLGCPDCQPQDEGER